MSFTVTIILLSLFFFFFNSLQVIKKKKVDSINFIAFVLVFLDLSIYFLQLESMGREALYFGCVQMFRRNE